MTVICIFVVVNVLSVSSRRLTVILYNSRGTAGGNHKASGDFVGISTLLFLDCFI